MVMLKAPKLPKINSLMLVMMMFLSSAALRIVVGADEAFAQADTKPGTDQTEQLSEPLSETTPFSATSERERLARILKILQEKEARLNQKEEEQFERQRVLDDAAEQVKNRLAEIEEAEQQLRATLTLSDSAAEDDLSRLTSVYESMKAKDAAPLFEAMEPEFAAGFLGRMRPDAAANIMAGIKPDFAYTISVLLAGRNAQTGKNDAKFRH